MTRSLIAVGITSNYLHKEDVHRLFQRYARAGYSLSFFHPLRVTAAGSKLSSVVSERVLFEDFVRTVGEESLKRDTDSLIKRLRLFKSEVLSNHFNGLIRVVLHIEYSIPFWCSSTFSGLYLEIIPMLMNEVGRELEGHSYEMVVEVHLGFTSFDNCFASVRKGNVVVSCESQHGVGRDFKRLVECFSEFKREIACELAGTRISICIELRTGSAVYVDRRSVPQTLENHYIAVLIAKKIGIGVVLDLGQSVGKIMGEDSIWRELFNIGNQYPDLVDEIHVHSPLARKRRGHGLPSLHELERFAELIRSLLKHRARPLGVIYEVVAVNIESLAQNLNQLLNMIEGFSGCTSAT